MDWAFPNKSAGPRVLILSLFLGPFLPLFAVRGGGDSIASCFLLGLPYASHATVTRDCFSSGLPHHHICQKSQLPQALWSL